jgi:hypothetical protein
MILMQFVADGGEKVKVESLEGKDRGKVRFFVDHGPAGVSSFFVPAGVVIRLGAALVSGQPTLDRAASDSAAQFRGEVLREAVESAMLPGLQL